MENKSYYVYHIFKDINDLNKGYIGVTNNPKSRFRLHSKSKLIIGRAIRKYGLTFENNFKVLYIFDNAKDAYDKEKELRPKIKMGWNLGIGGFGGARLITEKHKRKISLAMKGENNPYFGKKHSKEIKEKISNTLKSKSEEWRIETASNAGKANLGKIRSEENKKNYSYSAKLRPKYTCPFCNKTGQYNSMIAYHGDNCKKKHVDN